MGTADKLLKYIGDHGWDSTQVERDDDVLEIHPVHATKEAGFTLWRRRTGGQLDLITTGHTYDGELVNAENRELDLSDDIVDRLENLLHGDPG